MKWKNIRLTFLIANFLFLCLPKISFGQGLDFYSRIDDAGNSVATNLTKRHLQDYNTFRTFGRNCRGEFAWLDTKPIDVALLEEVSVGNYNKLLALKNQSGDTGSMSTEDLINLGSCLTESYQKVKNRAFQEQAGLEQTSSIGIFMDGDTKNSDFDLITDIEKINAIIFTTPMPYAGEKNKNSDFLRDFLAGKKPNSLWNPPDTTHATGNAGNVDIVSINTSGSGSQSTSSGNTTNTDNIPWAATCNLDGTIGVTSVHNMVDASFMNDLNATLRGGDTLGNNVGVDYSSTLGQRGNTIQNAQNNTQSALTSNKDFTNSLPCNGIFCITFGSNITSKDALVGGNSYAIESILDAHIKKTEKISWSDLSAQKMTNNTFQLPFVNLKFRDKVAGGSVFSHSTPQTTKKLEAENTPEKKAMDFDEIIRCANVSAGLGTDEKKGNAIIGAGYQLLGGHNTENISNATKPLDPLDITQIARNNDCSLAFAEITRNKNYEGFSTQINELQAFSDAMNDIIRQILDTETKLDSVPSR